MDETKQIVEEVIDAVIETKTEPLMGPLNEEPKTKTKKKEMRGRPKGSSDNKPTKIKLKPTPKSAVQAFKEDFKGLDIVAVYGVDDLAHLLGRRHGVSVLVELLALLVLLCVGPSRAQTTGSTLRCGSEAELLENLGFVRTACERAQAAAAACSVAAVAARRARSGRECQEPGWHGGAAVGDGRGCIRH